MKMHYCTRGVQNMQNRCSNSKFGCVKMTFCCLDSRIKMRRNHEKTVSLGSTVAKMIVTNLFFSFLNDKKMFWILDSEIKGHFWDFHELMRGGKKIHSYLIQRALVMKT